MRDPVALCLRELTPNGQIGFVVAGGILVHLSIGTLYTVGNVAPYIASYLRVKVSGQEYVTYSLMSWLFAATVAGQCVSAVLAGILERKIGPRWSTLLGGFIMSSGVLLTYLTVQHSFWTCLLTFSIIVGFGTGMAYNPPLVCVMKWLPRRRGLANGLVLAGFGLGAFVFNQVQTKFVNPNNYAPNEEGFFTQDDLLERVPKLFLLLGAVYMAMQIVGCIFLIDPVHDEASQPILEGKPSYSSISNEASSSIAQEQTFLDARSLSSPSTDVPPRSVLRSGTFWCLWFTMILNGQSVNFISSYFKIFGQTFIFNDHLLATIGSASSIFNSTGRVMWGLLGDRFRYQGTMVCLCAFLTAWTLTIYATSKMGAIFFLIWICGMFLTFSGQFALFPMAVSHAFGPRYVGINYGLFFSASALTAVLNAALTTSLLEAIGFRGMFALMGSFSFLSFVITCFIQKTKHGRRLDIYAQAD